MVVEEARWRLGDRWRSDEEPQEAVLALDDAIERRGPAIAVLQRSDLDRAGDPDPGRQHALVSGDEPGEVVDPRFERGFDDRARGAGVLGFGELAELLRKGVEILEVDRVVHRRRDPPQDFVEGQPQDAEGRRRVRRQVAMVQRIEIRTAPAIDPSRRSPQLSIQLRRVRTMFPEEVLDLEFGDGGDRGGRIDADRCRERCRVHHVETGAAVHFAEGVGDAVLAAVTHGAAALVVHGQPFAKYSPHWIGAEPPCHALLAMTRSTRSCITLDVSRSRCEPRPEPPLLVMRVFDNPEAAAIEVAPLHENDSGVPLGFAVGQRPQQHVAQQLQQLDGCLRDRLQQRGRGFRGDGVFASGEDLQRLPQQASNEDLTLETARDAGQIETGECVRVDVFGHALGDAVQEPAEHRQGNARRAPSARGGPCRGTSTDRGGKIMLI